MYDFNYPDWINVLFWSLPLTTYMWLLGMWATMKDNEPEEEKEEMTLMKALGTTLLCVLVGVIGIGGGSWYTTNKIFDPLIKQIKNTTSNANVVLKQVKEITSREEMNKNLNKISNTVINEVSSDFTEKIDDVNVRILLLSDELMEVHIELEQQLSDLEDDTKSFVNNKVSDSEKEVKKQMALAGFPEDFGKVELSDKVAPKVNVDLFELSLIGPLTDRKNKIIAAANKTNDQEKKTALFIRANELTVLIDSMKDSPLSDSGLRTNKAFNLKKIAENNGVLGQWSPTTQSWIGMRTRQERYNQADSLASRLTDILIQSCGLESLLP